MEGQVQSLLLQDDYLLKFVTEFIPKSKLKLDFPDSSVGKESPAIQETPVPFLGQEDPLEKG